MTSALRTAGLLLLIADCAASQQVPDRVKVSYFQGTNSPCESTTYGAGLFHRDCGIRDYLTLASRGAVPQDSLSVDAALKRALGNLGRYWKLEFAISPSLARNFVRDQEDVLVVKLPGSQPVGSPVPRLFWSDTERDMIVYAVPERFVRSPESVRDFIESKAVWSLFSQGVVNLQFEQTPIPNGVVFGGSSSWDPQIVVARQRGGNTTSGFYRGEVLSEVGYISVTVLNRELPERFPPLSARVRSWTTARLLAETGRGDSIRWERRVLEREQVILGELVKRSDLSADDLLDVFKRGVAGFDFKGGPRLAPGVRLAWGSVPQPVFLDAVRRYVAGMSPRDARLSSALELFVDYMDLDLQMDAIRALRASHRAPNAANPLRAEAALKYLARRGNTAEALSAIEDTTDSGLADARTNALQAVRSRLPN